MDKNYYTQYFNFERNHWWFKVRNKILLKLIQKYNKIHSPEILNIGAATGYSSELLEKTGRVVSVENDAETCQYVKSELNLDMVQTSILDLPFNDNSFDVVCAFDVIEHVEDPDTAVKEMLRVCRNNGLLVISLPAFQFLWSEHDEINHHYKRYRLCEIKKMFTDRPAARVFTSYFNFFLFSPIAFLRIVSRIFRSKKRENKQLKSDFERFNNGFLNKILYFIFNIETSLMSIGVSFFTGVSLVAVYRKMKL